jgi:hypothetical protein
MNMKKMLIALALLAAAVISIAACSESTGAPAYVEPAMEGSTALETTSEVSTESASQASESESAAQTVAAISFSTGKTAVRDSTMGTTAKSTMSAAQATAKPAVSSASVVASPVTAAQTTTTTRYVLSQATTTTTRPSTTTSQYIPPATTTTTRPPATTTTTAAPATTTQAKTDYESMGQAAYQDEAIKALNAMRAERGLPPMTVNATLMANSLTLAQKMAAAGSEFHSTDNLPGCESVSRIPVSFPAKLLGETLANHTPQFLESSRSSVGIAVIRQGSYLYAVMQGA